MRFVLFKAESQYGSLRLHIEQLAETLRRSGHDVRVLDLLEASWRETLNATFADPPDCYFGLNGIGGDVRNQGGSLYDQLRVVYATLYLDHPLHHAERLAPQIRRYALLLLDRSHLQFVRAWPLARAAAYLGFLPPGGNELPEPVDTSDEAFAQRDIPFLFTGTYRGAPQPAWSGWPDSPAKDIVGEVAERMIADGRLPILDAFRAALAARGGEFDEDLFNDFVPLLRSAQVFVEAHQRDRLLHVLGEAEAPLHVYGAGWESLVERYPSFRHGGVGSFEETLRVLRRSRLVLNTNNGFVAGGHERVFTAMCAGAAVFSDASRYYAEAFKEGREIVTFEWSRVTEGSTRLLDMIENVAATAAVARAGHKRAMAEHRWADRAAKLVKIVKQVR